MQQQCSSLTEIFRKIGELQDREEKAVGCSSRSPCGLLEEQEVNSSSYAQGHCFPIFRDKVLGDLSNTTQLQPLPCSYLHHTTANPC